MTLLQNIQLRSELVLQEAELRQIWYVLVEYATKQGDDLRINYDGFSQVRTSFVVFFSSFFSVDR
jgi:hypothetical protein